MTRPSYVGVSGVVSQAQVEELSSISQPLTAHGRALLLGVKATHKTLMENTANKYGTSWYPLRDHLPGVFDTTDASPEPVGETPSTPALLRVVQAYAEPTLVTSSTSYLADFIATARSACPWLTHIQFDMLPFHTHFDRIRDSLDALASAGVGVIVQAHGPAMDLLGGSGCIQALADLPISHCLFDSSHGTGTSLDIARLTPFVEEAFRLPESVGVGVAGGLDGRTITHLAPLLQRAPDLSWDAEGRLHPKVDHAPETADAASQPDRSLSMPVTRDYLAASVRLIESVTTKEIR